MWQIYSLLLSYGLKFDIQNESPECIALLKIRNSPTYKYVDRKRPGNKSSRRSRRKSWDNIKMDAWKIVWEVVGTVHMTWDINSRSTVAKTLIKPLVI